MYKLLLSSHELAGLAQLLHVLTNLNVGLEILGDTSVQTKRFLLVDVALSVSLVDTLVVALFHKRVEHASNHVQLGLGRLDLLLRGNLGGTT